MIKKERGVITCLSQEINGIVRDNVVAGIHKAEDVDEKLEEKLYEQNKENDKER